MSPNISLFRVVTFVQYSEFGAHKGKTCGGRLGPGFCGLLKVSVGGAELVKSDIGDKTHEATCWTTKWGMTLTTLVSFV
jgi:hypothetical protein